MDKEIDVTVTVTGDVKVEPDYKKKYYDLKLSYWFLCLLFLGYIISDIVFFLVKILK